MQKAGFLMPRLKIHRVLREACTTVLRDSYFGFKVLSHLISEVSSSASGKILEQGLCFLIPKKVIFFRIAVILFQSQLSVDLY